MAPAKKLTAGKAITKAAENKPAPVEKGELEAVQNARVIQLFDDYRGRPSREKIIKAGLYLDNDPRLEFDGVSIADYWLEKEFAQEIEFSDAEKLMLFREQKKPAKPVKERQGFRGHIEPTQEEKEAALLPPPETSPVPRNPVRQRPRPVTPAK